jgi:hypothetical protein
MRVLAAFFTCCSLPAASVWGVVALAAKDLALTFVAFIFFSSFYYKIYVSIRYKISIFLQNL